MNNQIESKWLTRVLYVLLFLFSLGFGNYEKYIMATVLLIYILVVFRSGGEISVYQKSPVVPLALWGALYFVFFAIEGNDFVTGLFYYFIGPVLFWLVGRDIASEDDETSNLHLVLALCGGPLIHGILNVTTSITGGYFLYSAEQIRDYWSGSMISRTLVGMYMTPFVCASIPILLLWDKDIGLIIKLLLLLGTIVALGFSIYVGNRTLLTIAVIIFAV